MKFILTKELGKLAIWLRILGFDSEYYKERNTASLIMQAIREERIILTRNHRLPKTRGIQVIVLQADEAKGQMKEALKVLKIRLCSDMMFMRCVVCNKELTSVPKENIKDKVPEYVYATQDNFTQCLQCSRIYWPGTHWQNAVNTLKDLGLDHSR